MLPRFRRERTLSLSHRGRLMADDAIIMSYFRLSFNTEVKKAKGDRNPPSSARWNLARKEQVATSAEHAHRWDITGNGLARRRWLRDRMCAPA